MNYNCLKTSAKTSAKLEYHRLSLVCLYARKTFTISSQNYPVHSDHGVNDLDSAGRGKKRDEVEGGTRREGGGGRREVEEGGTGRKKWRREWKNEKVVKKWKMKTSLEDASLASLGLVKIREKTFNVHENMRPPEVKICNSSWSSIKPSLKCFRTRATGTFWHNLFGTYLRKLKSFEDVLLCSMSE